jgi:hypothetical protein
MQKYHDHHGSFFKVYVIDRDVMVHCRPSLPNLSVSVAGDAAHEISCLASPSASSVVRSVAFDSRYSYPTLRDFVVNSAETEEGAIDSCSSPLLTNDEAGSWKLVSSPVRPMTVSFAQQSPAPIKPMPVPLSVDSMTGNALYSFPASEKSSTEVEEMLMKSDHLGSKLLAFSFAHTI